MKSSASESIRNVCFNLELLSRSFRLERPGILALERPLERLWFRRQEEALKHGSSDLCFFFLTWLRFLIDFRFADFQIIRISALPVFQISSFSHLRFLKRLFCINLCLTLKTRLNGTFSEVVVLKSQFSEPKRKLLGWYSDSWANFHLWTVVFPSYSTRNVTQFHLFWASDFVSMAFKYGPIPAVSKVHLLEFYGIRHLRD